MDNQTDALKVNKNPLLQCIGCFDFIKKMDFKESSHEVDDYVKAKIMARDIEGQQTLAEKISENKRLVQQISNLEQKIKSQHDSDNLGMKAELQDLEAQKKKNHKLLKHIICGFKAL